MKNRNCYLFVFNGYADWEPSLVIAGLNQYTDFAIKTLSSNKDEITTMGGIRVKPDITLADVVIDEVDLLILPGGDAWDNGKNVEVKPLVDKLLKADKTIAAICGATSFLAQQGYLNDRPHTSNHLEFYLKKVAPNYTGENFYIKEHAVTERNFITANGTAIVPFAKAIFERFSLRSEELNLWFQFFEDPAMGLK